MKRDNALSTVYRVLFGTLFGSFVLGRIAQARVFGSFDISYFELSAVAFVLFSLLSNLRSLPRMVRHPMVRAVLPLAGLMLFSLIIVWRTTATRILQVDVLYTGRFFLYILLFASLVLGRKRQWIKKKEIIQVFVLSCIGIAVLGFIQYVFLPDTRFLFVLGWDEHYFRLISTLLDPPFTAAVIAVPLLILSAQKFTKRTFILLLVLAAGVLLTYSRASYIALAAALVVQLVLTRKKHVLGVLLLFLAAIPFLPRPASEGARLERTASIEARKESFLRDIGQFRPRTWITGNGWYVTYALRQPQNGIAASHSSSPNNTYVHVLESLGVPGALAFLYFLMKVGKRFAQKPEYASILTLFLVGSLFNNLFLYPWILAVFWSIASTLPTEDT